MLRITAILTLLVLATATSAVEVGATIDRVSDGDTIAVRLDGAGEVVAKVRLLSIDTAESHSNSHGAEMPEGVAAAAFLRDLLPQGTHIRLWSPRADALERDRYDRLLAFVLPASTDGKPVVSVQERIVAAGWSAYWRKYGDAPAPYHDRLLAAQEQAKAAKAGAWSTAEQWMVDKGNERTAPKH